MARNYKWQVPMKALQALTSEQPHRGWFTSAEISERSESLCRWEVSQRAVAVAMRRFMKNGKVDGKGEATNLFASQCRSLGMEV